MSQRKWTLSTRSLVIAAVSALVGQAQAGRGSSVNNMVQPTYGNEFTFTSPEMVADFGDRKMNDVSSEFQFRKLTELAVEISARCPLCEIVESVDRYGEKSFQVESPSKLKFALTTDPFVLEVIVQPQTLKVATQRLNEMQELIFMSAAAIGLNPHSEYGGGHIHVGLESAFAGNPLHFRNFVVEMLNYSDVFKTFGALPKNAAILTELGPDAMAAMIKLLADFDEKLSTIQWQGSPSIGREMIVAFTAEMVGKVLAVHPKGMVPPSRYQALNFNRILDAKIPWSEKTLEFRFFRAQTTAGLAVAEMKLIDQKILATAAIDTFIPLSVVNSKTLTEPQKNERLNGFVKSAGMKAPDFDGALKPLCSALAQ